MFKPWQIALTSRKTRRAFLGLGGILMALVILEGALRLTQPFGIEYIFEHERLLRRMPQHPLFAYLMPANMAEEFQGARIETNSEGLRGPQFSIRKPPGVKRILLVGDSVVLSWGVAQQDTMGAVLQRLLNDAQDDVTFEVISVAALSWNTRNQAEFLKNRAHLYQADALVLVIVSNDIVPKPVGRTHVPKSRLTPTTPEYGALNRVRLWLAERSYLFALVHRAVLIRELKARFVQGYQEGSPDREDAAQAFGEISEFARNARIPVIGFLYFLLAEQSSEGGRLFEEFYGNLFREQGLSYATFPEEIYGKDCRNSRIDPHQNAKGVAIMAGEIFSALDKAGLVFPPMRKKEPRKKQASKVVGP